MRSHIRHRRKEVSLSSRRIILQGQVAVQNCAGPLVYREHLKIAVTESTAGHDCRGRTQRGVVDGGVREGRSWTNGCVVL